MTIKVIEEMGTPEGIAWAKANKERWQKEFDIRQAQKKAHLQSYEDIVVDDIKVKEWKSIPGDKMLALIKEAQKTSKEIYAMIDPLGWKIGGPQWQIVSDGVVYQCPIFKNYSNSALYTAWCSVPGVKLSGIDGKLVHISSCYLRG